VTSAQIPHSRRLWLYVVAGLVMLFLIAPSVIVLPLSFSDSKYLQFPPPAWSFNLYWNYFESVEWRSATFISLETAILTVIVATPLGTAAAYGLHMTRGRLATAIMVALSTPMIVPIIFIAIGVFYLYARLDLLYTITGLVIAHSTLAIPFVVAMVASALYSFSETQERAARSLGASRLKAFFTVTFPQIRFSVLSGALLAFLTSFDEVIIALLISGGTNETLTRRMFKSMRDQFDPTIAAVSSILILISIGVVLLMQAIQFRGQRE
jgi:putative spermidine/putrescine transport system permease protein